MRGSSNGWLGGGGWAEVGGGDGKKEGRVSSVECRVSSGEDGEGGGLWAEGGLVGPRVPGLENRQQAGGRNRQITEVPGEQKYYD